MWRRPTLDVVDSDDLDGILDALDLLDDVKQGKLGCQVCERTIAVAEIHAIVPASNRISLICDRIECRRELARLVANGQVTV